jgi:pyridoxamine 5'-phosphate oxidase
MDDRTGALLETGIASEPLEQFRRWYADAGSAGIRAPHAMALATASSGGAPSVRMVLLKSFDADGFVFFTGYASRKAGELEENPRASLLFHWDPLGRQVRVEGNVARVPAEESDDYFATRQRGAQLAASASLQSSVLANREELEARMDEIRAAHEGSHIPRPEHWGGYRLTPASYEFWQHRDDRAHDRLRYRREGGGWLVERLAP